MKQNTCSRFYRALTASFLITVGTIANAAYEFETPPFFEASALLDKATLQGPNHTVDPVVKNDGMMNYYLIKSPYGSVEALSTAIALERIHEFNAIATLDAMRKSDEFARSVKSGSKKVLEGAKQLVTDPIGSVAGTISGVTKMFQRAGNAAFSSAPADSQDGRMKAVLGYTTVKRQYAAKLGVDPYSDNMVLQNYLDDVSWSAYAGGISTAAAFAMVPGAAGATVTVTRVTDTGVKADLRIAPLDLEKQNRSILAGVGIDEEVREMFLQNETYPPSLKTYMTGSLASMVGVKNRDVLLMIALQTDLREVAAYRERQAAMYAGYHLRVAPLASFLPVRGASALAAETRNGSVVLVAPIDYLAWTAPIGRAFIAENVNPALENKKKELWISGQFSEKARTELEALGWTLVENAERQLFPTAD